MSNRITAYFRGRVGVTEAVYQNDYGIVMNFDDIDLPAHFDCYFSTPGEDEAVPAIGADNMVQIPNAILARSGRAELHIPIHSGANDSEVEYIVHFKVIGRARPVDDGTPVQMTAIEQALALLQNPIGNIEQIVNEALAFTGDTFAEMQAQLDADQAAFKTEVRGDIADVESDFDNLNAQFQTAVSAVTVDSEVQNVRVGADNVTYASAGEAVRTQFTNLKSDLYESVDVDFSTLIPQTVYIRDASPYEYLDGGTSFFTYFIPAEKCGEATLLTNYIWGSYYAFLTSDEWTVSGSPAYCNGHARVYTMTKDVPVTVSIPVDCKYIAIRINNKNITEFSVSLKTSPWGKVTKLVNDVDNDLYMESTVDFDAIGAQEVYIRDASPYEYLVGGDAYSTYYTYFVPTNGCRGATLLTTYIWDSYYAFLKNENWVQGETPAFCDGCTGVYKLIHDVPVTVDIPDDCNFIAIRIDGRNIADFSARLRISPWKKITELDSAIEPLKENAYVPLNIRYRGIMAGFNDDEHKLRMFGTTNFEYFAPIGTPFTPQKGRRSCRDPYVMVYDGAYYIFYTDALNYLDINNSIGICKTLDFETFEEFDPIVCNQNFKICWAPSVFEENGNYYLTVTASTTSYTEPDTYIYNLDMDTLTISNETVINIGNLAKQLDFHFMKHLGKYYAIGKDESIMSSIIAVADSLTGPYSILVNRQYSGMAEEGQQVIRLDNGAFRLYINDYALNQRINYVDIPDITSPNQGTSLLRSTVIDSDVSIFHVSIFDFNRPYSFEAY